MKLENYSGAREIALLCFSILSKSLLVKNEDKRRKITLKATINNLLKEKLGLFVCRLTGHGLITLCARRLPRRTTSQLFCSDPKIKTKKNLFADSSATAWQLVSVVFPFRYFRSYFHNLQLMCHKEYFLT